MTAYPHNDRERIAHLAVRLGAIRQEMADRDRLTACNVYLSAGQIELIEEALLGMNTAMTLRGWSWYSDGEVGE